MEADLLYSFTVHAQHMTLECTMHKLYPAWIHELNSEIGSSIVF